MLLILDNFDSFTFNLARYFGELGQEVEVVRSNALSLAQINDLQPEGLVISPGPKTPDSAGISLAAIRHFAGKLPILGICLGHQSIGQVFGGRVVRAKQVMHGKNSLVYHQNTGLFAGLNNPLDVTRYHSLAVEITSLPACLEITAWTENNQGEMAEIMGLSHKTYNIHGVQFHPEAILTEQGHALLANFLAGMATVQH